MKSLINAIALLSFVFFLSVAGLWVYVLTGGKTLQKNLEISPIGSMVVMNNTTFGADKHGVGYLHEQTIYNYLVGTVTPQLAGKFDPAGAAYATELAGKLRNETTSASLDAFELTHTRQTLGSPVHRVELVATPTGVLDQSFGYAKYTVPFAYLLAATGLIPALRFLGFLVFRKK